MSLGRAGHAHYQAIASVFFGCYVIFFCSSHFRSIVLHLRWCTVKKRWGYVWRKVHCFWGFWSLVWRFSAANLLRLNIAKSWFALLILLILLKGTINRISFQFWSENIFFSYLRSLNMWNPLLWLERLIWLDYDIEWRNWQCV